MPAGGRRPRRMPSDVRVTSTSDRWGHRRARVEQCVAVLKAEDLYGQLVCEQTTFGPGSRFGLSVTLFGAAWWLDAEVLPNAVWRRGRVFFRCAHCRRRATRVYLPLAGLEPRCRRCWGLGYASQAYTYRPIGGPSSLWAALCLLGKDERRQERQRRARARWAGRRPFLLAPA
jgi:hypothetical protein